MNLNNLGKFKIGGAINTQFETSIGIERILKGLGQGAGGITSFLATLEFIGYILLIFWAFLFIAIILTVRLLLALVWVYKYFRYGKERRIANGEDMTDEEVARILAKREVTEEDEEEIRNFH